MDHGGHWKARSVFSTTEAGNTGHLEESLGEPMNSVLLKVLQWIQAQGVWGRRHITPEKGLKLRPSCLRLEDP